MTNKRERVHSIFWVNNNAMRKIASREKSPIGKSRYENNFFDTNSAFNRVVSLILPRR